MLQALQSFDLWLFHAMTPWHAPWLEVLMSTISISGTGSALFVLLATVALRQPASRGGAWRLYLTILLCYVTVDLVLKPAIARPRPMVVHAYEPLRPLPSSPRTASFPSGHSAAAFGAALAMSRMWPGGRVVWWTIAVLMGYSRVYLGHHYPLDVAGGAVIGVLAALWVLGGRRQATYAPAAVVRRAGEEPRAGRELAP